jgi:hypothetical protein
MRERGKEESGTELKGLKVQRLLLYTPVKAAHINTQKNNGKTRLGTRTVLR